MIELKLVQSRVRRWEPGDVESVIRHGNSMRVARYMSDVFPHPYRREDAIEWVARAGSADPMTDYAIEVDGEAAGGIGIVVGTGCFRVTARMGYWLGEKYWGRGIMTEVVGRFTEEVFARFPIERLQAGVFAGNPGSARVLEKAGFRLDGVMRRAAITREGEIGDDLIYSRLRGE